MKITTGDREMVAKIEKSLIFMEDDSRNHNMLVAFNYILQAITTARTEDGLRNNMDNVIPYHYSRYFNYGFGLNHMWVHQKNIKTDKSHVNEGERILIVEF
jgi:hypothetical protein